METLKTAERLALVRAEAKAQLPVLETAAKIGTDTYVLPVENGFAKVTISAIKDEDFDLAGEVAEYEADLADKAAKAEAKAEAKAAKEAEKAAKKA
jgi:hypothetical protein